MNTKIRCPWSETHELFTPYHDKEWGTPEHDDRMLFEMLNLEGAQAGLSWLTVLKKRENYRKAFDTFDAKKIIKYTDAKKEQLMQNEGIIRNRLKIAAVIENARAFLTVQKEHGSFNKYIWSFVNNKTIPHSKREEAMAISEVMSKELKKRGFKFVGATICFAFMQAVGMVNDHSPECFKYKK
ncbi:MAG: DNA-3-methyladenine glycosylase [Candidatus Nomurabacteria bacterium]|nr:DNA-3-methyladenine glycosylase [Candidatus Nomurabacteria bacterium]